MARDWNDCVRWERDGHSYHAQTAPRMRAYIQQLRAGYYAAITHMDHQIGRLVSALVEEQIATIRLFCLSPTTARCWVTT